MVTHGKIIIKGTFKPVVGSSNAEYILHSEAKGHLPLRMPRNIKPFSLNINLTTRERTRT